MVEKGIVRHRRPSRHSCLCIITVICLADQVRAVKSPVYSGDVMSGLVAT